MRIFRFMSKEEFKDYLKGIPIEGKFVKGKACFLEENVPSREKEDTVKQLTDLPLDFKSADFEGQMKELSELISPIFKDGKFEGQLKKIEYLSLADFMSKIRENVTADVLVEFQPKKAFEKEYNKVIMSYQKYLIEEIQSNGYSKDTLDCISYKIDLINGFKDGIGMDTTEKHEFKNIKQALADLEQAEKECVRDNVKDTTKNEIQQEKTERSIKRNSFIKLLTNNGEYRNLPPIQRNPNQENLVEIQRKIEQHQQDDYKGGR